MMEPYLINLAVVLGLMLMTWVASVLLRDASIVDPIWGFGFVLIAIASLLHAMGLDFPSWLLGLLAIIWGLRLGIYLTWRKLQEPEEDYRYQAMREKQGARFWWVSFFTIFLLQGVAMFLVSLPVQLGILNRGDEPLTFVGQILFVAGILFWLVGFFFETVGDWQLARFKSKEENQGKVLDSGLWHYTRHPNYFGDFSVWWGLWLLSLAAGGPWWTVICPLVMSWLLMKVSGVTLTEKSINERRPDYADYKKRTSPFFPWFPKSE